MKLIQKILSHGLLIAFFVGVFFLYLYRADLFPQWFGEEAQSVAMMDSGKPGQKSPVARDEALQPIQKAESVQDTGGAVKPSVVAETAVPPVSEQAPAVQQAGGPAPQQVEKTAAAVETAATPQAPTGVQATGVTQPQYRPLEDERGSAPAAEAVETAEAPVTGATQPQYRPLEDEQRDTPAAAVVPPAQDVVAKAEPAQMPVAQQPAVEPADPADFQSKLEQARALYWRQDIRGAVQAYQGLTESYPDQAEAWGELGNLYFSMQQSTEAAGAYAKAIELLIAKGDSTSARNLLEAMRRLDPGKASELEMQLR